jgi:hypothetical protein
MRICALILLLVFSACANLEQVPEAERTFESVTEAPGFTKDKIFASTKVWIAENFRSAKAVIEYESKEEGTIIGNGVIPYPCAGVECIGKADWKVPFTMRVDVKDQRFRLTFSNLRLTWPPSYNATLGAQPGHDAPLTQRGDIEAVKAKLSAFGSQILASMSANRKASDW